MSLRWKRVHWKEDMGGFQQFSTGDMVYHRKRKVRGRLLERYHHNNEEVIGSSSHHQQQRQQPIFWNVQSLVVEASSAEDDDNDDHDHHQSKNVLVGVNAKWLIPIYHICNKDDDDNDNDSNENEILIVVTDGTTVFRSLAQVVAAATTTTTCSSSNFVLEIGCSTGAMSEIFWGENDDDDKHCRNNNNNNNNNSHWIGFDTSTEMVETVRGKLQQRRKQQEQQQQDNNLHQQQPPQQQQQQLLLVEKIDPLKDPQTATEFVLNNYFSLSSHVKNSSSMMTTVFVDIGGNRDLPAVLRMIHWVQQISSSSSSSSSAMTSSSSRIGIRQIVVKSKELFEDLGRQHPSSCSSSSSSSSSSCDDKTMNHRMQWILENDKRHRRLPTHPLQACKRYSPTDNNNQHQTKKKLICRYHNFHHDGCKKGIDCPYDHEHCHMCLEFGHIAKYCPQP